MKKLLVVLLSLSVVSTAFGVRHNDDIIKADPDFATTESIKLKPKKAGVAGIAIFGTKEDGIQDVFNKTIQVRK